MPKGHAILPNGHVQFPAGHVQLPYGHVQLPKGMMASWLDLTSGRSVGLTLFTTKTVEMGFIFQRLDKKRHLGEEIKTRLVMQSGGRQDGGAHRR